MAGAINVSDRKVMEKRVKSSFIVLLTLSDLFGFSSIKTLACKAN